MIIGDHVGKQGGLLITLSWVQVQGGKSGDVREYGNYKANRENLLRSVHC